MKISDVKAHHIRIPYDAGVASFRQGASSITALEIVMVEVTTDNGLTGWGDAFSYVCPRTTHAAIDEMIAPQARGQEVPDAAGIPAFMEQIQRNLHLFGRYGITMFAHLGLDIALWDIAAACKGVPLHRLLGAQKRDENPGLCQPAADRRAGPGRGRVPKAHQLRAMARSSCMRRPRRRCCRRGRRSAQDIPLMVDMNCPMDGRPRLHLRMPAARPNRCSSKSRCGRRRILPRSRGAQARRARRRRRRERLHGASIPADDGCRRGEPCAALGDQGRRHHGISEGRAARGSAWRAACAALALFRLRDCWRRCICCRCATTGLRRDILHERDACLWRGRVDVDSSGHVAVPDGPGLGYEPDRDVMERYRVA